MVMMNSKSWRFIPAGAGNAAEEVIKTQALTVHPRGCGERPEIGYGAHLIDGSSPRVRGTRTGGTLRTRQTRFIPAGAGNAV